MMPEDAAHDLAARLWAVARRYAARQRDRDGLIGIVLYGSLVSPNGREMTPLSDIDMALIVEDDSLPAHFCEQRLVEGEKLDMILLPWSKVAALGTHPPKSLYGGGWLLQFLLKAFLRGEEDAVLLDPSGEIGGIRQRLRDSVTCESLVLPDAARWLSDYERDHLRPAQAALAGGDLALAVERAGTATWILEPVLTLLSGRKRLEAAAADMGVPEFAVLAAELHDLLAPDAASLSEYRDAALALWHHAADRLLPELDALLRTADVPEPSLVELCGDYPLFWPGNRITECGRLWSDVDQTFRWSLFEEERGDRLAAMNVLWPVTPERSAERWMGVSTALKDLGYDVVAPIISLLESPEYLALAGEAERKRFLAAPPPPTTETAARVLSLAEAMRDILLRLASSAHMPPGAL